MKIDKQVKISEGAENSILKLVAGLDRHVSPNLKVLIKESTNKEALKDMEGVGGYCPAPNFIQISIDKDNTKFKADPVGAITRSFAHELYHAMRYFNGSSAPDGSLLDCVVDEGLADQFVFETFHELPVWNKDLSDKISDELLELFLKTKTEKVNDDNYNDWFIKGSSDKNIPRWAGYSLGLKIVRSYQKKHRINSVLELLSMSSLDIVNTVLDASVKKNEYKR